MNLGDRIMNRISHALRFPKLRLVDDTGPVQRAQVDYGPIGPDGQSLGLRDATPVVYHFGFTANPPVGADAVQHAVRGDLGGAVVSATNHPQYRLKNLSSGDAALYDQRGAYIWLTATGLVIDGGGLPMTIRNVGSLTLDGDLTVSGSIHASGDITVGAEPISLMTHKHSGVQTGGGQSGAPI